MDDPRSFAGGKNTMSDSSGSLRAVVRLALGGGLIAFASISFIPEAQAQAFADVKSSLVDYSKAEREPHISCEEIGKFKSPDIAEIHATPVAAAGGTPAHC